MSKLDPKVDPKFNEREKRNIRHAKGFRAIRFCERFFKKTKKASNTGGGFLFASTAAATCFRSLSTSRGISTHPNRTSWPASLNIAGRSLPSTVSPPPGVSPIRTSLNGLEMRESRRKEEKAFPPRNFGNRR